AADAVVAVRRRIPGGTVPAVLGGGIRPAPAAGHLVRDLNPDRVAQVAQPGERASAPSRVTASVITCSDFTNVSRSQVARPVSVADPGVVNAVAGTATTPASSGS